MAGSIGAAVPLQAASLWSANTPQQITVDSLAWGDQLFQGLALAWQEVSVASAVPSGRRRHHLDLQHGIVTLASLDVAGQTWYDVTLRTGSVLTMGSVSSTTPWIPNDPLFRQQWHLQNLAYPGEDLNVTRAWQIATGYGVRIAVVDDGLDIHHSDLNVVPDASWDFRIQAHGDPSSDIALHGTAVAGLAAARGNNGIGVTGVAFDAQIVGLNLLRHRSDANDALAMLHGLQTNDIFTNSYGTDDGSGQLQKPGPLWQAAIWRGVKEGRQGKGVVYLWAAGNGASRDRSDYDGQAAHPAVLTVGAVDDQGRRSAYSENGANVLVVAPGGDYCSTRALTTTDLPSDKGFNNGNGLFYDLPGLSDYTRCMNGTSAAVPLVAGVIALMLETNPSLTWRDVRAILALTARKNQPTDLGWLTNGANILVHPSFGFGVVDAFAAVKAAQGWHNLTTSVTQESSLQSDPLLISEIDQTTGQRIWSASLIIESGAISQLENVELLLQTQHPDVNRLRVELVSPSGLVQVFMEPHLCRLSTSANGSCGAALADGFRFSSTHWLGEAPDGVWLLRITEANAHENEVPQVRWGLVLRGF